MPTLSCKTRGNAPPSGKPRIYFTCHPEDFDKYFIKITEDIFKTQDCAIYYTEDMTTPFAPEDLDTDLGSLNLVVVPVTFRLLTSPNRAMDQDIAYAKENNIPLLPFMMESGIDGFYASRDNFGERQYLSPYSTDTSEITYEEKLKKYLSSLLISRETAGRVRAAFDAYIFLSYRKKDRRYANILMRLIHSRPEYRDIAIWYDEFLTPGESFRDNIEKMLSDSKLFTLLVTPSILEEPNGKPNFVMGEEYPAAKKTGMAILPAEMVTTDKITLAEKFKDLPECVDANDDSALTARLADALTALAKTENDTEPEHLFLIGLAYLEGIDVEIDRERGVALIEKAANAGLSEAMKLLAELSEQGKSVTLDYQKAVFWREKLVEHHRQADGDIAKITLIHKADLANACYKIGDVRRSLTLNQEVYDAECETLGSSNPETLTTLGNLALAYHACGELKKALLLQEKAYTLKREIFGENDPRTLLTLSNLALLYGELSDFQKENELFKKLCIAHLGIFGNDHPDTIRVLNNLAQSYLHLSAFDQAIELTKKAYALSEKVNGAEHPETLIYLSNLAAIHGNLGHYEIEYQLTEHSLALCRKILGQKHPDTLRSQNNLAMVLYHLSRFREALPILEEVTTLSREILGEEHPRTLEYQSNTALVYGALGQYSEELTQNQYLYTVRERLLGQTHIETLRSLNNYAMAHYHLQQYQEALERLKKAYALSHETLGEKHNLTLLCMENVAVSHQALKHYEISCHFNHRCYRLLCETLGERHPDTLRVLNNLSVDLYSLKQYEEAKSLQESLLTAYLENLGENDTVTITVMSNLAATYSMLKEHEKAEAIMMRAYEARKKLLGDDHPDTVFAHQNLINIRRNQAIGRVGCYIATAVYGSYDCPEVWTLRRYRDKKLAKTLFGRAFIRIYYAISPTLVKYFGKKPWFNRLFKRRLDRMVARLNAQGFDSTPYDDNSAF